MNKGTKMLLICYHKTNLATKRRVNRMNPFVFSQRIFALKHLQILKYKMVKKEKKRIILNLPFYKYRIQKVHFPLKLQVYFHSELPFLKALEF